MHVHHSNYRISREEKNERERSRIKKKGDLLDELKELVKQSNLIPTDTKRRRFTEVYTPRELSSSLRLKVHRKLVVLGQDNL